MRFLLAGLLVVLAGCGGSGDDERLSAAELATRADAICAEYERELGALENPQSFDELATYARGARGALSDGLNDLRGLRPPADLESRYASWVEAGERALARIDELEQAADKDDQAAITKLAAAAEREDGETDRLASDLGMKECADD